MKAETKTTLYLTREELKVIQDMYIIFYNNNNIDAGEVWEILTAICRNDSARAKEYNYDIEIVD